MRAVACLLVVLACLPGCDPETGATSAPATLPSARQVGCAMEAPPPPGTVVVYQECRPAPWFLHFFGDLWWINPVTGRQERARKAGASQSYYVCRGEGGRSFYILRTP